MVSKSIPSAQAPAGNRHPPAPTETDYRRLGLAFGASVGRCIRAYDELERALDPRGWPVAAQPRLLDLQNARDASMALIYDCARGWDEEAACAAPTA
jgi:hypothetical protein